MAIRIVNQGEVVGFSRSDNTLPFVVAKVGKKCWIESTGISQAGFYVGFGEIGSKDFELKILDTKKNKLMYLNNPWEKIPNREEVDLKSDEYRRHGTYFSENLYIGNEEVLKGLQSLNKNFHISWFKKWVRGR